MGVAANDLLGDRRVHVGVLEQPQPELPGQHRRHELVDERLFQDTLADEIDEVRVAIGIRQFDVDARLDRELRRLAAVLGQAVAEQFRPLMQLANREIVRHDVSFESPLLAQDVAQQPLVGVGGDAVDLIVGGHHADGAALVQGLLERVEEDLAQNALRHVHRGTVRPGLRLAVGGEVLERGNDVLLVLERRVALESLHGRDPHAGDQIGVLAVGFLDASPPRLARHVHDGRQRLVRAARAGFLRPSSRTTGARVRDRT